jgi:hypothetical protein
MPEMTEENRMAYGMVGFGASTQSPSGVVSTGITSQYQANRMRIQFTLNGVFCRRICSPNTTNHGTTFRARVRLFRDSTDSTPAGGDVVLVLWYRNPGAGIGNTTIFTQTLTIPNTGASNNFIETTFDFSLVVSASSFDFFFEFQNPDASTKRFECELFCENTP